MDPSLTRRRIHRQKIMRIAVESSLLLTPVETRMPMLDDTLQIRKIRTVGPIITLRDDGPTSLSQALLQIDDRLVGDTNFGTETFDTLRHE